MSSFKLYTIHITMHYLGQPAGRAGFCWTSRWGTGAALLAQVVYEMITEESAQLRAVYGDLITEEKNIFVVKTWFTHGTVTQLRHDICRLS